MKRRLAARRMWGTGSIWVAELEPEPAPVQATVVHVVHHYVQLPDGQLIELPQQRDAITSVIEYPATLTTGSKAHTSLKHLTTQKGGLTSDDYR